jgi:hypothetical protein
MNTVLARISPCLLQALDGAFTLVELTTHFQGDQVFLKVKMPLDHAPGTEARKACAATFARALRAANLTYQETPYARTGATGIVLSCVLIPIENKRVPDWTEGDGK